MLQSAAFSVGPQFRRRGRKLIVRTNPRTRVLTLGLSDRTMVVDPDRRVLTVRDRRFWFGNRVERYPFDLIAAVSFHLRSGFDRDSSLFTTDRTEGYAVGLKLHGTADPDVHLFWFVGEGRMTNVGPLPDWVYWLDSLTDVCGTHEEEAQQFVTALGWVLKKPLVPR
jgi:hypothetical protein